MHNKYIYSTNPNDDDTDKDELLDYDEVKLGTDPNNIDSNGNGIKDGEESFNTNIELEEYDKDENVDLLILGDIKGKYIDDIAITNMEKAHSFITEDIPGYIGALFRVGLYKEDVEQNTTITFTVNKELVDKCGRIGLYEFDKEDNSLKEVNSVGRSISSN